MKNPDAEFAFDIEMELDSHFVTERFQKVARINQAVSEGSYKVNSKKLANILLLKLISELAPLDCPDLGLLPCPGWRSYSMQPFLFEVSNDEIG